MSVRTAAIIGLNWGLVHLRGLREAGCEVVSLAAQSEEQARAAAQREGVPQGTADIASLNDVDLVVIATPARTHADVIRALPQPKLICEKPLLGMDSYGATLPPTPGRLYVNYAFSFLATARCIDGIVSDLGPPHEVALDVSVELPHRFSAAQWFLEAASHPLSWLLLRHGAPTVRSRQVQDDRVHVDLRAADVPLHVGLRVGGEPGIHQQVRMRWPEHHLAMQGRFRPGEPWSYDPVLLDGQPVNDGEWSPSDCWMDANAASIAAIVETFRGAGSPDGLFDAGSALMVEDALLAPIAG